MNKYFEMANGKFHRSLTLLSLLLLALAGCVEKSVVFKVLQDGSALIHVRTFAMPSPFGTQATVEDQKGVSEAQVNALLKALGPGVTVKTNESTKNARGWPGKELILHCENVNQLKIKPRAFELLMAAGTNGVENKQSDNDKSKSEGKLEMSFALKEEQLTIDVDWHYPETTPVPKDRAQDPFAKSTAASNPFAEAAMMSIMRELRIGLFVETERKIATTDATFPVQNDTLITIFSFDGAKVDQKKISEISQNPPSSPEEYKSLLKDVEGFSVEMKPKVVVQLK